jgi:hypothetical protein
MAQDKEYNGKSVIGLAEGVLLILYYDIYHKHYDVLITDEFGYVFEQQRFMGDLESVSYPELKEKLEQRLMDAFIDEDVAYDAAAMSSEAKKTLEIYDGGKPPLSPFLEEMIEDIVNLDYIL